MALRALLLDIGGVVVRTPFELLPTVALRVDVPDGALAWRGPFAPEDDELWQRMQAGELTERAYWARRCREIAAVADLDGDDPWKPMQWLFDLDEQRVVRPETRALMDDARAEGRLVALLTNDLTAFHGGRLQRRMPLLETVDALIDRSGTTTLKPHPAAYTAALDALGRSPHEVLFVDDQPHNVDGARRMGLHALHFDVTDPAGSVARVRTALRSDV
ncbi:MAG: HAD-IA family hydrolase [Actinobacteria bacterium]|nr:HAD-IA family hydrolase [Actinomycetota bacterium]